MAFPPSSLGGRRQPGASARRNAQGQEQYSCSSACLAREPAWSHRRAPSSPAAEEAEPPRNGVRAGAGECL